MKFRLKIAVLSLMMIAAAAMGVNAVKSVAVGSESPLPPEDADKAAVITANEDAEYYLRDCSGYVAVFKGSVSNTPIEITEIETETLNDVDKKLLADGIPAEDRTALIKLLEDLGS